MTGARIRRRPWEQRSKSWAAGFSLSRNGLFVRRIILPFAFSHCRLTSFSAGEIKGDTKTPPFSEMCFHLRCFAVNIASESDRWITTGPLNGFCSS